MEEDNFKLRVNKIFGCLSTTPSSSFTTTANLTSLWSLTDDEIEKKEWNRPRQNSPEPESTPYPSHLDGFFSSQKQKQPRRTLSEDTSLKFTSEIEDLDDLDDEDGDEEDVTDASKLSDKPEDHDDEEWKIRSSIGLDCTLDYEDEEDEYDKLAVGDLLNTSKVRDYARIRNTHMTATLELKEDTEATENLDSVMISDETQRAGDVTSTNKDGGNLKSIMKRKESNSDTKMQKRVHFDPECKNDFQDDYENAKESSPMEDAQVQDRNPAVPDYLRNPSKYTCYTFDSSSDVDEESNKKAYMDFLNLVRKPNPVEDLHVGHPKSVAFTPRKKIVDSKRSSLNDHHQNEEDDGKDSTTKRNSLPILIAAADVQESEVCAMDEDEPETVIENSKSLRKSGRQYRSKASSELDHNP